MGACMCWKAINSDYMPTDYLSLSNTNRDIFDFTVKAGPPDVQLDSLEKKMASIDSVCQTPMEHHMKCAAMVAALARADCAVYGDLVTNLTARSYSDIDKISLAEIRSLALSAYTTAQQRRTFQYPFDISDREEVCSCTPRQRREEEAQLRSSQQG